MTASLQTFRDRRQPARGSSSFPSETGTIVADDPIRPMPPEP
jgi:hypothetical protein